MPKKIFTTLEKLRQRPVRERRALAFSAAATITGVIFIIWAVSFLATLHIEGGTQATNQEAHSFGVFMDSIREATETVGRDVEAVRTQIHTLTEEAQQAQNSTRENVQEDAFVIEEVKDTAHEVGSVEGDEENSEVLTEDSAVDTPRSTTHSTTTTQTEAQSKTEDKAEVTSSGLEIIRVDDE